MESFIGNGQFNYINSTYTRQAYHFTHAAITQTNLWDFIKQNPGPGGYTLSTSPELYTIYNKIEELGYHGHSGSSFAISLRAMNYIANHGEQSFINKYFTNVTTY